jgi:hypothetical protein
METKDPSDQRARVLRDMREVRRKHIFKLPELLPADCLNHEPKILCVVEERATFPRAAELSKSLIVIGPD